MVRAVAVRSHVVDAPRPLAPSSLTPPARRDDPSMAFAFSTASKVTEMYFHVHVTLLYACATSSDLKAAARTVTTNTCIPGYYLHEKAAGTRRQHQTSSYLYKAAQMIRMLTDVSLFSTYVHSNRMTSIFQYLETLHGNHVGYTVPVSCCRDKFVSAEFECERSTSVPLALTHKLALGGRNADLVAPFFAPFYSPLTSISRGIRGKFCREI